MTKISTSIFETIEEINDFLEQEEVRLKALLGKYTYSARVGTKTSKNDRLTINNISVAEAQELKKAIFSEERENDEFPALKISYNRRTEVLTVSEKNPTTPENSAIGGFVEILEQFGIYVAPEKKRAATEPPVKAPIWLGSPREAERNAAGIQRTIDKLLKEGEKNPAVAGIIGRELEEARMLRNSWLDKAKEARDPGRAINSSEHNGPSFLSYR